MLHRRVESLLVHGEAVLRENLLCIVERESERIVQLEGILTAQPRLPCSPEFVLHGCKDLHARLVGFVKLLLFRPDDIQDKLLLLLELRIAVLRGLDDTLRQRRQERTLNAEFSAVTDRAADDAAEDIAPAIVRGHDAVGDHEGHGARMIGADSDRDVGVIRPVLLISNPAGQLTDQIPQALQRIHVKNGTHILHCDREPLEAHAGINVLLDQIRVIAVPVIVELGEYDIPDLHVAVALTAHDILRPVSVLFSAVIVNLGAGTARS